ncbi:META domain-containing protein [Stappia sp.]|uniref:META domain-containing protein n=1 Tax=Stappia sp. TaxID=1870903 RepID=UPI0032D94222
MPAAGFRFVIAALAVTCLGASLAPGVAAAGDDRPGIAGEWRIGAIATEAGALVDLDGATSARTEVVIDRHGLWAASAGCNRLRGTLEQAGRTISVSDRVMATKMACQGPAGDLERRFMKYFPAAVEVDGVAGRVLLRDASGAAVVLLVGR